MKQRLILTFLLLIAVSISAIAADATFNVATYNLRMMNDNDRRAGNGWERRFPVIASLIRFHEFDIFGTQEGFKKQLDDINNLLPGYEYIGVGREDGHEAGEYAAIFYRTDLFDLIDHGDFWLSETPDRPGIGWDAMCIRVCTWGHFRHHPSGQEFLFFNLHMDHIGTVARTESARLIKQKISQLTQPLPVILTGDFNVDQTSPAYNTIIKGGLLLDAHDISQFVYQTNGTFNSFMTDGYSNERIDHIFVSPGITVKKYGVLTDTYRTPDDDTTSVTATDAPAEIKIDRYRSRTPSDHFPVKTTISLPGPENKSGL